VQAGSPPVSSWPLKTEVDAATLPLSTLFTPLMAMPACIISGLLLQFTGELFSLIGKLQ